MNSRERMVEVIRDVYNLDAPKVLTAMLRVPREEFIPLKFRHLAYEDEAVAIGNGQTISQPYTVAFMTSLLELQGKEKVLEIGTGSGYQAAILSCLSDKVFTIERISSLAEGARKRLKKLGFTNVMVRIGSGEGGWPSEAPFDAILLTAGLTEVPDELFRELKDSGTLVAPLGVGEDKIMTKYTKIGEQLIKKEYGIFRFVPFVPKNDSS